VLVSDFCLIILEISPYVLQHIKPALQLDVQQLIVWYSMTQTCFSEQIKPWNQFYAGSSFIDVSFQYGLITFVICDQICYKWKFLLVVMLCYIFC